MPDTTENYGLTKPKQEEFYDINVHNENMDKIDSALKDLNDNTVAKTNLTALYSVELTFTDGVAEYSHSAIKSNSICFAQRRSGAVGYEHNFSVHSFDGTVRLCCEGATGTVNVNLLIINN